eukprot:8958523-Pyramimonas_sp.AAC.1
MEVDPAGFAPQGMGAAEPVRHGGGFPPTGALKVTQSFHQRHMYVAYKWMDVTECAKTGSLSC